MTQRAFANWLDTTNDVTATFLTAGRIPGLINLAGGLPDPGVWPVETLAQLAQEAVRDHPSECLGYGPVCGQPRLRDAIAARFSTDTLRLSRENVLVTTGGTQALAAIGAALLNEGQAVAVQSPAYLGALDAWRARGPRYLPMDLEAPEYDPEPAMREAQFAYVVPNFSNPSGRLVPLAQRRRLLDAARATGCWLVEDDPYGSLLYDGAPTPSLLELSGDVEGPVLYCGTVSKELAPGLRVGWIVGPQDAIAKLADAKQGMDMFSSGLCQMVAAMAMERSLPEAARPAMLALYRSRRDALCAALDSHLADHFDWVVPTGGMFVWLKSRDPGLDTDALMAAALENGVCISPSSVFDPLGRLRHAMRLNFTLNPPERLEEGVRRLAGTINKLQSAAA